MVTTARILAAVGIAMLFLAALVLFAHVRLAAAQEHRIEPQVFEKSPTAVQRQ